METSPVRYRVAECVPLHVYEAQEKDCAGNPSKGGWHWVTWEGGKKDYYWLKTKDRWYVAEVPFA